MQRLSSWHPPTRCFTYTTSRYDPQPRLVVATPDSLYCHAAHNRWSLSSGRPVCANSFEGHTDWVNAVVYAGSHVASCSNDGTVKLWSPKEGETPGSERQLTAAAAA